MRGSESDPTARYAPVCPCLRPCLRTLRARVRGYASTTLIPRSLPAAKAGKARVARIQHFEANDLTGLGCVLAYDLYAGLGSGF